MKKNNMGKLLGIALVVAIISTGLFYRLFAMKANSQTGHHAGGRGQGSESRHRADARPISKPFPGRPSSFPRAPIGTPEEVIGNTVFDPMAKKNRC